MERGAPRAARPPCQRRLPPGHPGGHRAGLRGDPDLQVRTATQDDPEHGLSEADLAATEVLVFWSHIAQHEFSDEVADRIYRRILDGMGFVPLHSACLSKVFIRLMGTTCMINWREAEERSRVWLVAPGHPIAEGVPEHFEVQPEEMYGEHFDIPAPDELVFLSWFQGGEVIRSGCCFLRGAGRIFYFQPGHETYPTYHNANVLRVIRNAVHWAAPARGAYPVRGNVPPLEALPEHS